VDLVDLHGDALAVVPDFNLAPLWVNFHLDQVLGLIVLEIVSRVDQYLVCKAER
jgi:hypothetical protein